MTVCKADVTIFYFPQFSKPTILETYTAFVNNWNKAKDAIRLTKTTRPAFASFLETKAREHKGKLSLDNLLIKPVQKFPKYVELKYLMAEQNITFFFFSNFQL
jgi:RhoGEF domain